mmetsp:Transcript_26956/g.52910  ORF Transcript_26956/g.52910 Transcript_26956/m.52910 type:complete len:86 (-) Transcript_26956:49-306(-)
MSGLTQLFFFLSFIFLCSFFAQGILPRGQEKTLQTRCDMTLRMTKKKEKTEEDMAEFPQAREEGKEREGGKGQKNKAQMHSYTFT